MKTVPYKAPTSKPHANKSPAKSAGTKQPSRGLEFPTAQGLRRSARHTPPKHTRNPTRYGILGDSSDSETEESPSKLVKTVDSDGDDVMEGDDDNDSESE